MKDKHGEEQNIQVILVHAQVRQSVAHLLQYFREEVDNTIEFLREFADEIEEIKNYGFSRINKRKESRDE